ncbi:MAG: glycosyltransferase family 1 protein [Desulfobacterales bacterium]|nr:glycosyltransferase family 1 protein [Desulfobacterales bacterium]
MKNRATILYEPEMLIWQRYGGVSRYFCELLSHFQSDKQINTLLPMTFSKNQYLQYFSLHNPIRLIEPISLSGKNKIIKKLLKPVKAIMRLLLQLQLAANDKQFIKIAKSNAYDICHFTYYNSNALEYVSRKPIAITVHDMIHEIFPEQSMNLDTINKKKLFLQKANLIIAVSEQTKNDIVRLYNIPKGSIYVIHHGCSFEKKIANKSVKSMVTPRNYILYVGDRKGYKNFNFMLSALSPLLGRRSDLEIICAGGRAFDSNEKERIATLGLQDKVSQIEVNDYQLKNLYMNAQLFIFPSLYEGFGLPLLEAFHCGCPVVCSNSNVFNEIAEDAAIYFDPLSADSICNAVKESLSSHALRSEYGKRGRERVRAFSWSITAEKTKSAYLDLLSSK